MASTAYDNKVFLSKLRLKTVTTAEVRILVVRQKQKQPLKENTLSKAIPRFDNNDKYYKAMSDPFIKTWNITGFISQAINFVKHGPI